jgi:virulence factor Mce-like protein
MKMTGTVIKLGIFTLVLLMFTAIIIVVFGQMRFDRTTGYSAIFSSASGLRSGQFVRASGVEVGKVSNVELINGGSQVKIDFDVDRSLPLFDGTTASIRYLNLIGDRYMELKRGDSDKRLPGGGTIPIEHTEPALDLDALIGGFRPVFRALDPDKVNSIAQSIITIFQGQGGTINDILDQTASLTSALADRDQAIGEVVKNLNTVLDTTVKHQQQFDETLVDFEKLITGLKNREFGCRHQRRGRHRRRPARRQPPAAAEHRHLSRGDPAAACGPEGSAQRHPGQAANSVQHHRKGRRHLRRLLQLLRLRYLVEDVRVAAGRTGANRQAHVAALG